MQLLGKTLKLARSAIGAVPIADALWRRDVGVNSTRRLAGLAKLNAFSRGHDTSALPAARKVLIDGNWDNANYWIRYAIVRRALALDGAEEIGLLGHYSRKRISMAFARFGISRTIDFRVASRSEPYLDRARALLRGTESVDELMQLPLPFEFPSEVFFDGVLKRQRRASVDIADPTLPEYLAEAMAWLEAADELMVNGSFELVILSHALDYTYGAIAWAAIRHRIPVLTLYGDFGHAKFFRLREPADLFMYPERPSIDELADMPGTIAADLRRLGAQQLAARLGGRTTDVGAIYAYQRRQRAVTRDELAKQLCWDPAKPTIGIYNSNWFDYPHSSGLQSFRDFLDWIGETLEVAKARPDVNWLLKAHPCDDWYDKINGQRLEDLVAEINLPHIRLADKSWNGLDLMRAMDGIVTCHGTIGIEATSQLIPVMVPYTGWYGHAGFVSCADDREDYLSRLQTAWWEGGDKVANREKAELFAGWAFCVPDWHEDCVYFDDSRQDEIYAGLDEFLKANHRAMVREAEEVAAWFVDGHPYYHIFSMKRAKSFRLGNSRA